jgi:hypothetical protein
VRLVPAANRESPLLGRRDADLLDAMQRDLALLLIVDLFAEGR